jgi:hypothetical protein
MPTVFISYASEQEVLAQQLEKELTAKGITVWRDKTNLHAGQRWPKALGDAIAGADALLLLWSAEASQSDFVELEWNIAMAMQKPVMPCPLDETSLPPTLKPSHRIPGKDIPQAAEQIMAALKGLPPSAPIEQQVKLLETLDTVPAAEPQQVLQNLNTIVNQSNWTVGGNVYQAQGDIYLSNSSIKKLDKIKGITKSKLEYWHLVVGVIGGILGIILALRQFLPIEMNTFNWRSSQVQVFSGTVEDSLGVPIPGVEIELEFLESSGNGPIKQITNRKGEFEFKINSNRKERVRIEVITKDFKKTERFARLGDNQFAIQLRKK